MHRDRVTFARWIPIAVAVVMAALHGAVIVSIFGVALHTELAPYAGALTTGALTAALLLTARRAKTDGVAALATMFGALAAGALNAPLAWTVLKIASGEWRELEGIGVAAVLGGGFGAVCAIPFALLLWIPVRLSRHAESSPSRALGAWIAVGVGGWTAVASALFALYPEPRRPLEPIASVLDRLGAIASVLGGLGALAALIGGLHLVWRERWLARVRRGLVRGYRVVPAAEAPDTEQLELWSASSTRGGVLIRERSAPEAVYRGALAREPIAWVALEG